MSSQSLTDIFALIAIVVLVILGYIINDPYWKFLAYIFLILILTWRAIVYIQRAINLNL
jgi:hypothetical protein